MKWLKSTTQKTWVANGKLIPACVTPHNDYLVLEDTEYAELSAAPVIKSLINAGGILVLNEEPAEIKNSLDNLQVSNATLKARNTELETQIAQLQKQRGAIDIEAIKAEAQAEIRAEAIAELQTKDDRIKELEAALKEAKKAADSE